MRYQEEIFQCEGSEAPVQIAQRGAGCPMWMEMFKARWYGTLSNLILQVVSLPVVELDDL